MAIVYQTNPKTGVVYAYSSTSVWDKEAKKPRNHREYLGRVDPVTKKIIPKKIGRKSESAPKSQDTVDAQVAKLNEEIEQKDRRIETLQEDLATLQAKYRTATQLLHKITQMIDTTDI